MSLAIVDLSLSSLMKNSYKLFCLEKNPISNLLHTMMFLQSWLVQAYPILCSQFCLLCIQQNTVSKELYEAMVGLPQSTK